MRSIYRLWAWVTGRKLVWLKDFDGEITLSFAEKTPLGLVATRLGRNVLLKEGGKAEHTYVVEWKPFDEGDL